MFEIIIGGLGMKMKNGMKMMIDQYEKENQSLKQLKTKYGIEMVVNVFNVVLMKRLSLTT